MKIIQDRLRELRGNLSQSEFSKKIGVSQTSYSGWETAGKDPVSSAIELIARACHVSSDWLLGLTDDPTPRKSSGGVHINGVSHSVVNGHAVNSSISNGGGKDDSLAARVAALEKTVGKISRAIRLPAANETGQTEPYKPFQHR